MSSNKYLLLIISLFTFHFIDIFINLNVGLRQCDHLWQNILDMQILHLVPLLCTFVINVKFPSAIFLLAIMDDVRDEIIICRFMLFSYVLRKKLAKIDIFYGEIDNRGILLDKKGVFGESFDVKNDELWEFCDFEAFREVILVRLVLLLAGSVKFGEELKEMHLRNDVFLKLILK